MKKNPEYLIAVYKPEEFEISDPEKYKPHYCITVADIDRNTIVESVYKEYDKEEFEYQLFQYINVLYEDCNITFCNEHSSFAMYLKEKFPNKIMKRETILDRRVNGWTPSSKLIDQFYLRHEENQILKETFGSLNYFLDKTRGL